MRKNKEKFQKLQFIYHQKLTILLPYALGINS